MEERAFHHLPFTNLMFTQTNILEVEEQVYDDGYLRVEHDNYYAACGGVAVRLPRIEFLILSRLAQTPERIATSESLWRYAWGDAKPLNSESLHVHIYRLRSRLAPFGLQIDTMVNVGYRLMKRVSGFKLKAEEPET